MIMAFDFQAVRRDHPIGDVIGSAVKLKKAGRNHVGCCPFHPDRTPSFVVYEDSFHCFGCGEHGDVIDFIAKAQRLHIPEAIAFLTGGEVPSLTPEDRAALAREREMAEQRRLAAEAAAVLEAKKRWESATPINGEGHPYLTRKNVAPFGARREGQSLLIPIYNADGDLQSVQAIPAEPGEKKLFHAGASVRGGRLLLGDPGNGPLCICEGFATGASIHAATKLPVLVAFSKGNIATVAKDVRAANAGQRIILAADEDGIALAKDIAAKIGADFVSPELAGAEGSDFNDQAAHYGLEDVARTFKSLLESPATPFPLIWAKDVEPILSGNWIVKHVIPADGFVSIIGEPGCGKSFLALDLGCRIASGLKWRDRKVEPGLVAYLAAEGQRGQMNRVEAWKRENGITDMPFALIPVAINLRDSKADLPKLIQTIDVAVAVSGLPLSVLFIDTLNRSFGGGDENGEDMGQYVGNADALRRHFGCTTVHIHHIPKNGDLTERGHGSLRGAIDTSLGVSTDAESASRTLHCLKQKDGEDGWRTSFKLKRIVLGEDEDGEEVSTCVIEHVEQGAAPPQSRGPNLTPNQRLIYNELLATMEAAPLGVPRDIPENQIDRLRVGKVCARKDWRDRWIAVAGSDYSKDNADRMFRRALTDLTNKGLVKVWNDHAWPTFQ
jgi:phage/plasmid primase-like uncharacterized protein